LTGPALDLVLPGPADQRTGGYLYDARMAAELRAAGWEVRVHALDGRFPDPDARAVESLGGALGALQAGSRVLVDGLALAALPTLGDAEVVGGLRVLALVHHPLCDETGLDAGLQARLLALERAALAACRGVVVTSPFTAGRVRALGVPADRLRVALPGTRPAPPSTGPGPGAAPHLLCIGSVIPRKGQDVLVEALAHVTDLPWRATVVGSLVRDPAFAAALRARVADLGLGARIDFTGEVEGERLEGIYRSGSLFVLPSHYEGYGMALAEALARGLPVVSTRGGAIPGTVPEEAGILVPPGDVGALAVVLRGLLEGDAPALARYAAGARRHGARLPDWPQAAATLGHALLELAPDDAPGGGGAGEPGRARHV